MKKKSFKELFNQAKERNTYWVASMILDFTEGLHRIGGNEGCLEEWGKGDKRSIIEGNFMFQGKPEGLFGEKKVNGMYLEGKSKAFP